MGNSSSGEATAGGPGNDTATTKNFGHYVIVKELGRGGMATVYLALDSRLQRKVALKVPHKSVAADPEYRERFLREARSAATLSHPNICTIFEASEISGTPYMTMAFIEGKSLTDLVAEEHPLPVKRIANIVRRIAQAMEVAHRQKIVHRDLKPSNIMLDARKEPIVMDFGLARRNDSSEEAGLTQDGLLIGTPIYMAPEVAKYGARASGVLSDVYSLGTILYELLAGRPPYKGTVQAVLVQVMRGQPKPPSTYRDDIDSGIEAICLKAIAKDPAERFQSMGEFAGALKDYLQNPDSAVMSAVEVVESVEAVVAEPEAARSPVERRSASSSGVRSGANLRRVSASPRRSSDGESFKLVATLVGVCVLAMVVIIGAIVALKHGGQKDSPEPSNQANENPATPPPPAGPPAPVEKIIPDLPADGRLPRGTDDVRMPINFAGTIGIEVEKNEAPGGWWRFKTLDVTVDGAVKDQLQTDEVWKPEVLKEEKKTFEAYYNLPVEYLGELKEGRIIVVKIRSLLIYPGNLAPANRTIRIHVVAPNS